MPIRVALNVVYAMLVANLDGDEREEFDAKLHGWDKRNEQANRNLQRALIGGGGD